MMYWFDLVKDDVLQSVKRNYQISPYKLHGLDRALWNWWVQYQDRIRYEYGGDRALLVKDLINEVYYQWLDEVPYYLGADAA
jgi:hypothetical protein